jgi:hypothetical protein
MHADFLHRAAEHAGLAHAIGEHDLIVSPMAPDELRRAIECPAQAAGAMFEPGLVDELIAQAAGRVGALPLLEYTLLELWNARRSDGTFTWAAFHALGGVEGALAARADATLTEHYTPAQQDELRHLLVRLVQPGEHTTDARRRALLADLAPTGSSVEAVQSLLAPLVVARLLVVTTNDERPTTNDESESADNGLLTTDDRQSVVEIAHEALIHAWPTFSRWIGAAREDVRFQLQLEQAAKEWQAGGENGDLLWSGLRLDRAQEWLARAQPRLNERDQRFLQASRERAQAQRAAEEVAHRERERLLVERAAERRNAARLRFFLAVAGTLLLVALFFAGFALNRQQAAIRAEAAAQQARASAEDAAHSLQSFADAGESLAALDQRPERALLLARAALPADGNYSPLVASALYHAFEHASSADR